MAVRITHHPPALDIAHRNRQIRFESEEGNIGCVAYPINYDELYNLKGRLLTLADAAFADPQQRKAHKDLVWQTLKSWMDDIERSANVEPLSDPQS